MTVTTTTTGLTCTYDVDPHPLALTDDNRCDLCGTPFTEAMLLRAEAAAHDRDAAESFERCDTDGFMSQWASGLNADLKRLEASLIENGGVAQFPALFDLDDTLVAAKLIDGRYGLVWGVLADDDPTSDIVEWVTAFPARESTMARKGYREGFVLAPAKAAHVGKLATNVRATYVRTDGGFSRDVEII